MADFVGEHPAVLEAHPDARAPLAVSLANICEAQRMILQGLGVSARRADETLRYTVAYVREHGAQLGWWRDLDSDGRDAARAD